MATEMIAIRCPICGTFLEAFDHCEYRCPRCTARLNTRGVMTSEWGRKKQKEHDLFHGIIRGKEVVGSILDEYKKRHLYPENQERDVELKRGRKRRSKPEGKVT